MQKHRSGQKRRLGRSPIEVAPFCLGGNVFGWTADEATSFSLLDAFVDAGFDFIDTADIYTVWAPGHAGGESETIIGRWLARSGKRNRVVLATKLGMAMGDRSSGLAPARIRASAEASLRRLQTDRIDLYYAHCDDETVPLADVLGAFDALVQQGKVRILGASNFEPSRLAAALEISDAEHLARYEVLQPKYNLCERGYEAALQAEVQRAGLSVAPYKALASGFLTGKYRCTADLAASVRGPRAGEYLNPAGLTVLQALDTVAARRNASPAQIALAWLMAQPGVAAPLASATTLPQLQELMAAATIRLDAADLAALDEPGAPA